MIRRLQDLRASESGATIMEFAIIAPVLCLMLIGFFDLGRTAYVRSVLQGAIQKSARDGTLESANTTTLNARVEAQVRPIAGVSATFTSTWKSYTTFSNVALPEPYNDTTPANGSYDTGECFEDENGNGAWDADKGRTGLGGASDIVLYTMTVSYPRIFPMNGLLGWPTNQTVAASTVLRNQPYGVQTIPTVTQCP